MTWIVLLIFFAIQILIAHFISKKIKNENDYLKAGSGLPIYLISFSLFATWFGAETCIGTAGEVYKHGLAGARSDPFGYGLSLVFVGLLVAKKLWQKNYLTLCDFYCDRFGTLVEKLAVWILLPSSLLWGAAQIRAFGQVISSTTDLPINLTLNMAFVLTSIYTLLGGLLGDIVTDLIQGIFIAVGLFLILFFVFQSGIDFNLPLLLKDRLTLHLPEESWPERIDRFAIPVLGSIVAQEVISRILAAKNGNQASRASYYSAALYFSLGSIPVILGLLGPALLPDLEDKEQFLVQIAKNFLPNFIFPFFVAALISAILATIDSVLLSCSALLSHNLLIPAFKITDEKKKLHWIKTTLILCACLSYILAFLSDSIYQLMEASASFGMAGILVITLMGLWTKNGNQWAAIFALITGVVAMPLGEHVFEFKAPFLITIISATLAYFLGGLISVSQKSPSVSMT